MSGVKSSQRSSIGGSAIKDNNGVNSDVESDPSQPVTDTPRRQSVFQKALKLTQIKNTTSITPQSYAKLSDSGDVMPPSAVTLQMSSKNTSLASKYTSFSEDFEPFKDETADGESSGSYNRKLCSPEKENNERKSHSKIVSPQKQSDMQTLDDETKKTRIDRKTNLKTDKSYSKQTAELTRQTSIFSKSTNSAIFSKNVEMAAALKEVKQSMERPSDSSQKLTPTQSGEILYDFEKMSNNDGVKRKTEESEEGHGGESNRKRRRRHEEEQEEEPEQLFDVGWRQDIGVSLHL